MVFRNVEQLEVVLVGFHIRCFIDLKPHLPKNAVDFAQSLGGEVQVPRIDWASGQGHVQVIFAEFTLQLLRLQGLLPGVEGIFERLLDLVDHLAHFRTLFRSQPPHLLELLGQFAFAAQVAAVPLWKSSGRVKALQFLLGLLPKCVDGYNHVV